jgi:hypothetical protein
MPSSAINSRAVDYNLEVTSKQPVFSQQDFAIEYNNSQSQQAFSAAMSMPGKLLCRYEQFGSITDAFLMKVILTRSHF